ncbi:cysteine--tRNA ligase [archaeon]|jgi:cysteinyl-tRNA synthetase|nr:cysteine--tRNA ligase [archaeon]MBT6182395.1 cysteine--tRNA ligase [archaeon]MBT7251704.1 cysteine--tRNA ligase [archaeon]MBT7660597.1 cysteine--tRNA ligase [archaeon]
MKLKLYNTLTHKKETFKPINPKEVKIYTCGPTVYWFAHVGNFRSYIFSDLLKRVLLYNEYKVKHIINVTDVGHLTSDADEGTDKLESAAAKENKTATEVAKYYFNVFKHDFSKLDLLEPDAWPRATQHIKAQIMMIQSLEKKGYTYKTSDGIYFDTSKFKNYGKLSRKKAGELEAGKRVSLKDKKNITDFALWKFSELSIKRQQEWKSPWGIGFPGWHIECSAMASEYLGKHFDIHTGGEDHVHIHHENEIAQSEACFEKSPWVNYWMHNAFLEVPGGKMSKSKGKIETLEDLEKKGISELAYKYFMYTAHYRKPLTWSSDAIQSAVQSYDKLKNITTNLHDDKKINKNYIKKFEDKINDDLDMPGALAVLWELLRDKTASGKVKTVQKMEEVFGLRLFEKAVILIPKKIKAIADERQIARKNSDWKKSDELRKELEDSGWKVKDTKDNYELEKQ